MKTLQHTVFGFLLTDEPWNDLADALAPYASEGPIGKYIYCREVHPAAPTLQWSPHVTIQMVRRSRHRSRSLIAVMCCVSGFEKSQIGFIHV